MRYLYFICDVLLLEKGGCKYWDELLPLPEFAKGCMYPTNYDSYEKYPFKWSQFWKYERYNLLRILFHIENVCVNSHWEENTHVLLPHREERSTKILSREMILSILMHGVSHFCNCVTVERNQLLNFFYLLLMGIGKSNP